MRRAPLIRMIWTGQSLIPDGNYAVAQAHDRLGEGEVVAVDIDPERTTKNHNHFFTCVNTAWQNLPDGLKDAPYATSADVLRKHALISTGHCDTDMVTVGDGQSAEKVAAFVSRMAVRLHGYAITHAEGGLVHCYTPHSQSLKEMGNHRFKQSKTDVLSWLANLIGVSVQQLSESAKREAA